MKNAEKNCDIKMKNDEDLCLREVANRLGVLRQTIYSLIRKKRIKAYQVGRRWYIKPEFIQEFIKTKFSRDFLKINGELLYDNEKGIYSVRQAAEIMGVPYQHVAYLVRKGFLRAKKIMCHHIIMKEEMEKYMTTMEECKKIINN